MEQFRNRTAIGLLLIAISLLLITNRQFFIDNLNSDFLYLFETVKNIMHQGLRGQNVPAAPYYFPDMLLMSILMLFTQNITLLHLLYSSLFLMVFICFIFNVMKISVKRHSLAIFGTVFAFISYSFWIMPQFYFLQFWPTSHLSLILFGLGFLYFYMKHSQGMNVSQLIGLFIITYLMFISDNLLFAQFLFPFVIFMGFEVCKKNIPTKLFWHLLLIFLMVVLVGAKVDIFLEKYFDLTYSNNVSLFRIRKIAEIDQTIMLAYHLFLNAWLTNPKTFIFLLACTIVSLVIYCSQMITPIAFRIMTFFYIAMVANVILGILVGKFTALPLLRYFDIIFIYPPILFALSLMHILNYHQNMGYVQGIFFFILFISTACYAYQAVTPIKQFSLAPPYGAYTACIDQLHDVYGIQNGLAEFWGVRPVRMLSKRGIRVSQIDKTLNFLNFTDNKSYFYDNEKQKTPLAYQFIIVNHLATERILQSIGPADHIANCSGYEVWLYLHDDHQQRLNHFFSSKINSLDRLK